MGVKGLINRFYWRAIQSRFFSRFRTRIGHVGSFVLRGKTKTNSDLSILVFATYKNVVLYLSNLVYAEEPKIEDLGRTTYNNIPSIIADKKPDVVFAEFNKIFVESFSREFLILPRVNFFLDLSPPWETTIAKMRRIRRRNIGKIENLPYTYEATKDLNKFDFFYDNMYLPFVSKTPEDSARLTPRALAREWLLNGELTFVKSGEEYLAAILYHPENSSMHVRLVAYEEGMACQAALYYVIKKAKKEKYTEVNYGETAPFMDDGLFYYKRSWGMKMKPKLDIAYAIKFCNFEKPVQNFLAEYPFIFTDSKSLVGLALLNTQNIDDNFLRRKYYTLGLQKLVVLYPTEDKNAQRILASDSQLPGGLSHLIELTAKTDFDLRLVDFSK